ncbi:MAG: HAD family hydrolase [Burkholderiales bacterium]|nr:HAD family hydrolase [Burkholderiales bacterium]
MRAQSLSEVFDLHGAAMLALTFDGREHAMGNRIAAVVFDFEGTLVDFQWRLGQAEDELRAAFAAQGYATRGNYAELWNAAADSALPQGRLAELRRALAPVYDRWDADAATRWSPRPGAAALLEALAGQGIGTALVSNCGRAAIAAVLGRFGLDRRLAPVVCRDDVVYMKPHAEGALRALAELRAAPEEALFVGDSRADVLAARAAGLRVAVIRGGECDEAAFAALQPDYWVSRLDEVAALLGGE